MNENLDLTEILKDCPKGTKLYSLIWGECKLDSINYNDESYPIKLKLGGESLADITKYGRHSIKYNGECTLFPSKEVRTWDNFKPKKPKFDPKTLMPFDKVLVRDANDYEWSALLFSHVNTKGKCIVAGCVWEQVIPYNEETKHLIGAREEAPEFYRYWEE